MYSLFTNVPGLEGWVIFGYAAAIARAVATLPKGYAAEIRYAGDVLYTCGSGEPIHPAEIIRRAANVNGVEY